MKFISKSSDHTLIRRPADRIMDELRRPIILRGERVNFAQHQYNTDDEDTIQWLLNHPRYGMDFTSAEVRDKPVEKPAEVKVPIMIRGANATTYAPPKEEISQPEASAVPWATKEDVSKMLDERLEPMMEKILIAINAMGQTPNAPITTSEKSSKKVFHCPICHKEFNSGIAVGRHKKEAHK